MESPPRKESTTSEPSNQQPQSQSDRYLKTSSQNTKAPLARCLKMWNLTQDVPSRMIPIGKITKPVFILASERRLLEVLWFGLNSLDNGIISLVPALGWSFFRLFAVVGSSVVEDRPDSACSKLQVKSLFSSAPKRQRASPQPLLPHSTGESHLKTHSLTVVALAIRFL